MNESDTGELEVLNDVADHEEVISALSAIRDELVDVNHRLRLMVFWFIGIPVIGLILTFFYVLITAD